MKYLIPAILVALSPLASACPGLNPKAIHTEVAVACNDDLSVNFSLEAAVNQMDETTGGGECRVELPAGQKFYVVGNQLTINTTTVVGTLQTVPSCYWTGTGEIIESTWNPVTLK